jgi:hypothetical protein
LATNTDSAATRTWSNAITINSGVTLSVDGGLLLHSFKW